ncbi:DUF3152 domain-containing protein [Allosalinactinospora lopnorensis]|uniref:DUF3152 domain-containing protein n=1 Tax=Allosalinactinospora lopnorensis TaxID=1352348 RepID=UPI000623FE6B|nr:DUF3152 domain-containing protein [Allosalinactinospora lopnorensis]
MSTPDPGTLLDENAAHRGSARRRPKHRRSRRYPLLLISGLATITAGAGVLVIGLPTAEENAGTDTDRSLSAPGASSEPPAGPAEEKEPVLMRSVVDEVTSGSGEMQVVKGESGVAGEGATMRYLVEVEEDLPGEAEDFAAAVEVILGDERGWIGDGDRSFQRVDSQDEADFRITLAAPDTVDALCAPLRTDGRVSCSNGDRAVINQNRWVSGVDHFDGDLETYRIYVVNHEVGHVLGHGHVDCDTDGGPAPVMQQQTFGLKGCEPNGWVHP